MTQSRLLLFSLSLVLVIPTTQAWAAKVDAYAEFVRACKVSFAQSSEGHHAEVGKASQEMCNCVAKESRLQKVTLAILVKETKAIEADPHYQIQDKGLLASFQVCAIDMMHAAEPEGE